MAHKEPGKLGPKTSEKALKGLKPHQLEMQPVETGKGNVDDRRNGKCFEIIGWTNQIETDQ